MTKKMEAIAYIVKNIEQVERAKSDYAFSNNAIREVLTNIYCKVATIEEVKESNKDDN